MSILKPTINSVSGGQSGTPLDTSFRAAESSGRHTSRRGASRSSETNSNSDSELVQTENKKDETLVEEEDRHSLPGSRLGSLSKRVSDSIRKKTATSLDANGRPIKKSKKNNDNLAWADVGGISGLGLLRPNTSNTTTGGVTTGPGTVTGPGNGTGSSDPIKQITSFAGALSPNSQLTINLNQNSPGLAQVQKGFLNSVNEGKMSARNGNLTFDILDPSGGNEDETRQFFQGIAGGAYSFEADHLNINSAEANYISDTLQGLGIDADFEENDNGTYSVELRSVNG